MGKCRTSMPGTTQRHNQHPCLKAAPTITDYRLQTNKQKFRCGNRKGLLGRNDQTHHRMGPKTMDATPPIKRNTQADIQLPGLQTVRRKQFRHQEERDGSKAKTMQSTNQARGPVSPPHLYHPNGPTALQVGPTAGAPVTEPN